MHRKTFIAVASLMLLAACSSPPVPVTPSAAGRVPVNSDQALRTYVNGEEFADARTAHDAAQAKQLEVLKRQIYAMREYLIVLAHNIANEPKPIPQVFVAKARTLGQGESMEVRDQSIVFRVTPQDEKAEFSPSLDVQAVLLKASREAKTIDVRGRTDSDVDTVSSRVFARNEAESARRFLIKNGIPANRIHVSFAGSGAFVLDNSTDAGRAFNKRVEIETMDLDTTAFRPSPVLHQSFAQ